MICELDVNDFIKFFALFLLFALVCETAYTDQHVPVMVFMYFIVKTNKWVLRCLIIFVI